MLCFVDIDGVLADFVKAAGRLHGVVTDPYPCPGSWDLCAAMGLDPAVFWSAFDEAFWADLPWTADGQAILATLEHRFGVQRICLMTSPAWAPSSASGKMRWIQTQLPRYARAFLIGPPKHFAAHFGSLLVDDSDHNVAAWRECGGHAILLPRPWNSRHGEAHAPLEALRADLRTLDLMTSFHDH